jgi:hypothetical protein
MSLPIYEAIGFQEILEKGGHSKPWVVLINIKDSIKPYVVKLYNTSEIEKQNKMTAEILGNILAKTFNLNVPDPAIINFSLEFQMQLNDVCTEKLSFIDERPKFGSEYLEGPILFNPQISRKAIKSIIEPANLYAYDYFLCNRDRNINKPNLLVKQGAAYLIDHEMGLEITKETIDNFNNGIFNQQYKNHLFYSYLQHSRKDKLNLFNEFAFYLEGLNLNRLDSYFTQLEQLGFNTHKDLILEYWQTIKNKSAIFVQILVNSIQ